MNRRNSKSDMTHIQAAHDAAVSLGAKCNNPTYEAAQRNSKSDMMRIQEMHDISHTLGAKCDGENMPGVLSKMQREALTRKLEAWQGQSTAVAERIDTSKARQVLGYLEANMTQAQKHEKGIKLLTQNGYTEEEAKKIADRTFGVKKN